MNSLVGYGVSSSESDSDGEEDVKNVRTGPAKEEGDEASVKRTRNFMLEPGSDSESDSESDVESPPPPHPQTTASRSTLPAPSLGSLPHNKLPPPSLNACSDSSVFANPFKAQVDQKLSALQKHVPLTLQAKPSQIGGKRMCVAYRKNGRCRFGIKCKFAHDSDLQTPVAIPADSHPAESEETPGADQESSGSCGGGSRHETKEEEEEEGGKKMKKRRVGLSNTLIPPKRAMKLYATHRDKERLNMS